MQIYRRLLISATLLAFAVIALGAFVRLSDAGLGCPDWPGCYGHLLGVPDTSHEQQAALQAFPDRPVNATKAWKEMLHRYLAGTLGLLILSIFLLAWRQPVRRQHSPTLATLLLGIVGMQALLGMWTVTLLLKPVIVTLHLLGGMTTLSLLVALLLKAHRVSIQSVVSPMIRLLALCALLSVIVQIALGGWVSSNYAALACQDFPLCQGQLQPEMDFKQAFGIHRELGMTTSGTLLPFTALTAIHWSHRLGALIVTFIVGLLAAVLIRTKHPQIKHWGWVLSGVLLLQISMGIANIVFGLPLALAVAHNMGAATLLATTLSINMLLSRQIAENNSAMTSLASLRSLQAQEPIKRVC